MELKEFWEYFGFTHNTTIEYDFAGSYTQQWWTNPNRVHLYTLPEPDLNNLDKYCFPKLIEMGYEFNIYYFQDLKEWQTDIQHISSLKPVTGKGDTEKEALYNAIVGVING